MLARESLPFRIFIIPALVDIISISTGVVGSTFNNPAAGWNPNSPAELFLGMLPYLLVFLIVPIGLLLVCWCSRSFLNACSRFCPSRLIASRRPASSTRPTGCLGRLVPWTVTITNSQTRTDTPVAGSETQQQQQQQQRQPATLFTNYTNYNPILEGELDLFPITYSPQPRDAASNRCSPGYIMDLPTFVFLGERRTADSMIDESPPRYTEEPPPTYESLFNSKPDDAKEEDGKDDSKVT